METKEQHLSDFDFELPESLIAQYPLKDRAASRLLHVKPDGSVEDLHFRDILNLLKPGDLLVFNNTKVIKARLNGKKETGGVFEAMTERVTGTYEAISMMRASKAAKPGTILYFDHPEGKEPARAEVLGREGEFFRLRFDHPVLEVLDEYGKVPLPPIFSMPLKNPTKAVIRRSMPSIPVPLPHRRQGSTSRMNCFSRFAIKAVKKFS